jgi:sulfur carrier protein
MRPSSTPLKALPGTWKRMKVVLNGKDERVSAENVDALVNNLELVPETVLVEHNGVALLRSEWPQTPLADGDRVEILKVAAGG